MKAIWQRDWILFRRGLVPALIRTMAMTNPSGKQNTFAGQVLPAMVMIECKQDKIPLSYVNAYEEPVFANSRRIVADSIRKLMEHVNEMDQTYGLDVKHRMWLAPKGGDGILQKGEKAASFSAMLDAVGEWVKEDRT